MENNSLYRRYRPDSFEGVIGQDHIVRTLKNQVVRGKVGHAYLFTGTRGTGKTSTAKIFAKAINCLSPVDGSPCGKCAVCRELSNPSNLDIVEIDAASNTGVDDIRDLKEKVQFNPSVGKKKVFIIDEVHMLSASAFNALLKTLEEPPEHVVFILATTEVHKIPATILSRCLRFDFRLISEELIATQISRIFDEQGVKYEPEAIHLIAQAGNGSDRDALSTADMCLSYSDGKCITYANVLEVLGAGDPATLADIFEAIAAGDTGAALTATSDVIGMGKNISVLANDLASVFRSAVFLKTSRRANEILKLPQDQVERLESAVKNVPLRALVRGLDAFTALSGELKLTSQPRILFEAAVVRVTENISDDGDLAKLEKRVAELEKGGVQKKNLTETPEEAPAAEVQYDSAEAVWHAVIEHVNAQQNTFLHIAMEKVMPVIEGNKLVVTVEDGNQLLRQQNKLTIGRAMREVGSTLTLEMRTVGRRDENTIITKILEDFEGVITLKD